MKILLLILSLLLSTVVQANESAELIVCPLLYYSAVKKMVEENGSFDKYKHCAVSCALTLRCPATDVLELGVLKELIDVVGPGNAEINDLKADYEGVALASTFKAKTDRECMNKCHQIYPEPHAASQCPVIRH
jgi:hypothetical protein